jgi:hypothetical protein
MMRAYGENVARIALTVGASLIGVELFGTIAGGRQSQLHPDVHAGWAILLLRSALGLKMDGVSGRISFVRPALPVFLNDLEIRNLRVGPATVDLHLTRHGEDANVKVLRRVGEVEILGVPLA